MRKGEVYRYGIRNGHIFSVKMMKLYYLFSRNDGLTSWCRGFSVHTVGVYVSGSFPCFGLVVIVAEVGVSIFRALVYEA